jgi:hypothetical protein
MNKTSVRQGLEEEEKMRELPEDMVHKKMRKKSRSPNAVDETRRSSEESFKTT